MEDAERQQLLDENASLRVDIVQLKETIDTLCAASSTITLRRK